MWRWYLSKARPCNPYSTEDLANGGNGYLPITLQYRPYTAKKAREVSIAGGDFRENFTNRSYLGKTNTAYNEADLDNILECRRAMGDKPVIVCATVNNPMVMHEFEAEADAIVAEFGVSRAAVLDVDLRRLSTDGRLRSRCRRIWMRLRSRARTVRWIWKPILTAKDITMTTVMA